MLIIIKTFYLLNFKIFDFIRLVVAFSLERLVAVYFPLKLTTICSKNKTHCIVCFLIAFALIFYSFTFYTSGIEKHDNESNCVTIEKHFHVVSSIVLIDIILATILPFILITIFNVCIGYKLKKLPKLAVEMPRKSRGQSLTKNFIRLNENSMNTSLIISVKSNGSKLKKTKSERYKTYSESTKTLLIISFVFLLLHFPLAINKLWYFVSIQAQSFIPKSKNDSGSISLLDSQFEASNQTNTTSNLFQFESNEYEELFERVTCYIFYLNFSLNFFLYTYNGSKFRKIFLKLFRKNFISKWLIKENQYEHSRDRFSVVNFYNT